MNRKTLYILFLASFVMEPALSASLLEVYQRALQSDPLIHEAESRRLAALEGERFIFNGFIDKYSISILKTP